MASGKGKEKVVAAAHSGALFAGRKSHPLPHRRIGLPPLQCPHQVVNDEVMSTMGTIPQEKVAETPMMAGLVPKAQSAAAAQWVSPHVEKKNLALGAKLVAYTVQLTVFA